MTLADNDIISKKWAGTMDGAETISSLCLSLSACVSPGHHHL
jgi:hypothetical protein